MASRDYMLWLGHLQERVAATSRGPPFELPSPAESDAARVTGASTAYQRIKVTASKESSLSSGHALRRAQRQLAASRQRPKSQGWEDWGSGPLSVEYADAMTDKDAWPHTVASSATSKMNKKASAPVVWTVNAPESTYAPPSQRLSKLEAARQQAANALVLSERQRAAEVSENAEWLSHLDDEIHRAKMQLHASYKDEYTVMLTHAEQRGFGMTLETGSDGITRVTDVQPRGSAHEASVVKGSVVIAVAGCTLERGQGQDGLIPLTAICGHSTVEFRFRRPSAAAKRATWREFDEYAELAEGKLLLTIEYSAGHLHARYEWAASQVREAVAKHFPGITVLPKPLDTHAPKHRSRVGAFELQLAWRSTVLPDGSSGMGIQLNRSLLFSKLQTNLFPHIPRLLSKLRDMEKQDRWPTSHQTIQPTTAINHQRPCIPAVGVANDASVHDTPTPSAAADPTSVPEAEGDGRKDPIPGKVNEEEEKEPRRRRSFDANEK